MRARGRCGSNGMVLGVLWLVKERQREGRARQVRASEEGGHIATVLLPALA